VDSWICLFPTVLLFTQQDMKSLSFDEQVLKAIPSDFFMLAGADDSQESQEAYNVGEFELPNPAGKAGGLCTSAFLQVMYGKPHRVGKMSWTDILHEVQTQFKSMGYVQVPVLSSSRYIDVQTPMYIVPPQSGKRRALIIGINYCGQKGELRACHADATNLRQYLITVQGFDPDEILTLMDDGNHQMPTKENIMTGMKMLTAYSQPGDVAFVSFSGHGGRVVDVSGDEDDGYDETIIPVDFQKAGQIIDDDILKILVIPMRKGVYTTVIMDCCHSGTVMDLPYVMTGASGIVEREVNCFRGQSVPGNDEETEETQDADKQATSASTGDDNKKKKKEKKSSKSNDDNNKASAESTKKKTKEKVDGAPDSPKKNKSKKPNTTPNSPTKNKNNDRVPETAQKNKNDRSSSEHAEQSKHQDQTERKKKDASHVDTSDQQERPRDADPSERSSQRELNDNSRANDQDDDDNNDGGARDDNDDVQASTPLAPKLPTKKKKKGIGLDDDPKEKKKEKKKKTTTADDNSSASGDAPISDWTDIHPRAPAEKPPPPPSSCCTIV
jgi:metacaspase-1